MNSVSTESVPGVSLRVLIIDDDRDWCEAAAAALEGEGIGADCVYDAAGTEERLGEHRYDAAIVDVLMPDRSGVDVVRELRENYGHHMPILIATGASVASGVCEGLLAGADEEFFKFDSDRVMVAKLRRLWRSRAH